ncbi:MAG: Alanine--tRNA ligase [Methanomassiliicoccales archaeon PtaU1.Bin124]|nr:MAG: Alanine--tRNA ligase [Methanomassiliicoccales archaeon PtaU1.Bin124]
MVEIVGLDAEACGGIHCSHTGFVGPIRIRRTKRIQDGIVRVEYTAGLVAVTEMQSDKATVESLAERWNVSSENVIEASEKLMTDLRDMKKRLEQFSSAFAEVKVRSLLSAAKTVNGVRLVVHQVEEGENADEMSKMLAAEPKVVAVIAVPGTSPKVLVTRSADVDMDCKAMLREVMSIIGGGGGGKPDFAQGGGGDAKKIPDAFAKVPEMFAKMCPAKS